MNFDKLNNYLSSTTTYSIRTEHPYTLHLYLYNNKQNFATLYIRIQDFITHSYFFLTENIALLNNLKYHIIEDFNIQNKIYINQQYSNYIKHIYKLLQGL